MRNESSTGIPSISMMNRASRFTLAIAVGVLAVVAAGCSNDQAAANNQLIQQQQTQLERQQQELEALQANQNQNTGYMPGVATSAPGGCDKEVESVASQRGGDRFAAGDFPKALGYYQDALTACPNDDRAQVNVARTYEAMGNNVAAINHYRIAADSNGPTDTDASEEAKSALLRLQASRLP